VNQLPPVATVSRVSACTILLLLAGCAVGPDYKAPESRPQPTFASIDEVGAAKPDVAPTATESLSADALATWWQNFEDPELDSLIERAIAANLDIKLAEARVREARANLGISESGRFPNIVALGSATRSRTSGNVMDSVIPARTSNFFNAELDAAYEIDVFGGVRRSVEASEADLGAAIEGQRDILITVLGEVAGSYLDLRGFQQRIALNEEVVASSQGTVDLTTSRFRAGLSADLEVAQAQAQLAERQSVLPTLREGMRAAVYRLSILLGQEPGALYEELSKIGAIPKPPSQVPIGLPSDLLTRRPDIRRAERALASATAQIGVATADLYPRFSLTGTFAFQSSKLDNWADLDSRAWSFGPAVKWNVFSGGRIRSQIQAAGARQEQALYTYDQVVLTSLEEVENSLTSFIQEQSRRAALAAAVDANTRAVNLSTDRYRSGVGDFLNVLDAQRQLYLTQDELVQSEALVSRNLIALYKALGGGWKEDQGQPQAEAVPGPTPSGPAEMPPMTN
jgi:NodT family efflux transporter outer membrane factor (OMF) lipoprotein